MKSGRAGGNIPAIPFAVAQRRFHDEAALFIDARSPADFAAGHIPGARSIPYEAFDDYFSELADLIDTGTELIVYCSGRECDDALLLAAELRSMGVDDVVLFVDGFDGWKQYGGAIE